MEVALFDTDFESKLLRDPPKTFSDYIGQEETFSETHAGPTSIATARRVSPPDPSHCKTWVSRNDERRRRYIPGRWWLAAASLRPV